MFILVNSIGILLIAFIVWWFFFSKVKIKDIKVQQAYTIYVDHGVYSPAVLKVQVGKPLQLTFIRKDASPCAEIVLFPDFDKSAQLPLEKPHQMEFTPQQVGEFDFTCQMNMYRGKLIVVDSGNE